MIFFLIALEHSEIHNLQKSIKQYLDISAGYVIAMETAKGVHSESNGQHFHICAQMTEKQYDSFRKSILVRKYQLRGQAKKDLPRQYGKIKDVRDETKFLAYTVKDKNIIYENIDTDIIKKALEQSYTKPNKKSFEEELMEHLKSKRNVFIQIFSENGGTDINPYKIEELILIYCMHNTDKVVSLSKMQYYTNLYLQQYEPDKMKYLDTIINYLKKRI